MPTYDFKCKSCEHMMERFYQMSTVPKTHKCPECGKRMKRLIGPGSTIIFKGGGWPGEESKKDDSLAKKILDNAPPSQLGEAPLPPVDLGEE